MAKKPNILLLYSDQHNSRVLGCYGNNEIKTPNLDKLAEEGIRFNNAYTQNPICTPSRICILSGQYVHNFGNYGLMGRAPMHLPHLFKHFKRYGYMTGMAGKTHTPTGWLTPDCDFVGDGYGFEIPVTKWNVDKEEGCQGMNHDSYTHYLSQKGLGKDRDDKILQEWYELYQHNHGQGVDARSSRLEEDETIEAWSADQAIKFIEKAQEEDKPFCFWMTVPRPHQTYAPAKKFWDMYDEDKLTLPPNSENTMEGRHISARKTQKGFQESEEWRIFEPKDWESSRRRVLHGYYANVSQVDDAMGRVLDKLDELGIRENTIIVYTSDHGEFAGEHGMIEKAPGIGFRCVTRVPSIWSWKGHLQEGETRDALVESIDFLPTVSKLAGIPLPNWVDGCDISSVLEKDDDVRDIAVTENAVTKTIHTKKYKFTQYLPEMNNGKDFGELYDIEKDPWELKNLYFDKEYENVKNELRYKLYCWLVKTTRNVTVNPKAPSEDWVKGWDRSWEIADELYDDDGKIGFDFIKRYIDKGWMNYL